MEWKIEWNSERTQLQVSHVTGGAQSRLNYLVYLLSQCRSFMRSTALPTIMLPYPSMVLLLIRCFVIVVLQSHADSRTKNKGLASQDCSYSLCRLTWMCLMAEISTRSSVSSLQSLSVHLDPRSLVGLTTLVATVVSMAPMHGTGVL